MSYKLSGLFVASVLFCFPAALQAGQSPVITTQPLSQTAVAGSSATFTVAATGTAPLGLQWKFNGANLSGATNLTLRLDNVQPAQAGTYSVRVSNPYGSAQSSSAQLTVNVPALITNQPMSVATAAGATVTFAAGASGTANGVDTATATAVDAQGNVFVTGYAQEQGNGLDYVTLKYNSAGVLLWRAAYNRPADQDDQATALALDSAGNVYVTGASRGSSSGWDYATLKYDSNGNRLWVARYNGAGQDDAAAALAVDASGNVYVTGSSKNSSGH